MLRSYFCSEYTLAAAHYLMSEISPTCEGSSLLHHVLSWGSECGALAV